jgi:hypothetical protein
MLLYSARTTIPLVLVQDVISLFASPSLLTTISPSNKRPPRPGKTTVPTQRGDQGEMVEASSGSFASTHTYHSRRQRLSLTLQGCGASRGRCVAAGTLSYARAAGLRMPTGSCRMMGMPCGTSLHGYLSEATANMPGMDPSRRRGAPRSGSPIRLRSSPDRTASPAGLRPLTEP